MGCTIVLRNASLKLRCAMQKKKARDDFWFVLAIVNFLVMIYPLNYYLQADSSEDNLVAVFIIIAAGLVLAIVDAVSIAVAYSQ